MFRPSHESLLLQNAEIDRLELPRIQDDDELEALKESGALQPIIANETLRFDPRLDPSRRYCRPWTRDFVQDIAQAYYHRFHQQIQVNSAVRTVKIQKKLRRHNRNAAPAEGETASSHLAGLTVDLQRRGMTQDEIHWMQRYLFYLKSLGLVEPEEERHQWVFHIMVSGRYAAWRETEDVVPVEHRTCKRHIRQRRRIALKRILRFAIAERPILPGDFHQIDHHILRAHARLLGQNLGDALIQFSFLSQLAPRR